MAGFQFTLDAKQFKREMGALNKKIRRAGKGAGHALAIQIAKDTEKYVPARTKSLANRTVVSDDTVLYPGPYARFLYYGKLIQNGQFLGREGRVQGGDRNRPEHQYSSSQKRSVPLV